MIFPPAVEIWRPLVAAYAGDLPVPFLLAWIQKESYGNPCSWTSLREAGIFQLMAGDNQRQGGTTEAALRTACAPESGTRLRNLTAAEANEQVRSGIQYIRWCRDHARAKLAAAGASWPESSGDFGKMVKWAHVAPGKTAAWLAAARAGLGRAPASWSELVPYHASVGIPAHWVANADWVGSHWSGMPIPLGALMIAGGAAVLYYLYRQGARR